MTNESKRHQRELADVGDRLSRRVSVYHMLLVDAVAWADILFDLLWDVCDGEIPLGVATNHTLHTERWRRALDANDATLRDMGGEAAE